MAGLSRKTLLRSQKYESNIERRGKVVNKPKEEEKSKVNPYLLLFFFIILVGSSLFQVIRTATSGPIF